MALPSLCWVSWYIRPPLISQRSSAFGPDQKNGANSRHLLRTIDSSYGSRDFTYDIVFMSDSSGGYAGGDHSYIGIGSGALDPTTGEPGSSIFLRVGTPDAGGSVDVVVAVGTGGASGLATFGQCYASAAMLSRLAQRKPLRYAEGLALISVARHAELLKGSGDAGSVHIARQLRKSKDAGETFVFATHGWCVDGEGRVVDPTWGGGDGFAYLGVVLELANRTPKLPVIKDGSRSMSGPQVILMPASRLRSRLTHTTAHRGDQLTPVIWVLCPSQGQWHSF